MNSHQRRKERRKFHRSRLTLFHEYKNAYVQKVEQVMVESARAHLARRESEVDIVRINEPPQFDLSRVIDEMNHHMKNKGCGRIVIMEPNE